MNYILMMASWHVKNKRDREREQPTRVTEKTFGVPNTLHHHRIAHSLNSKLKVGPWALKVQ